MASGGDHNHHIIPLKVYFQVIITLMILTVITVAASRVDFGAMNTVIAMLIASIKAGLVLAFFMHLKYDDRLFIVGFGTSVFFLALLYAFSWLDIYTRFTQTGIVQ